MSVFLALRLPTTFFLQRIDYCQHPCGLGETLNSILAFGAFQDVRAWRMMQ